MTYKSLKQHVIIAYKVSLFRALTLVSLVAWGVALGARALIVKWRLD
jgi:hypothetical protein